jgi:hypothetical protein
VTVPVMVAAFAAETDRTMQRVPRETDDRMALPRIWLCSRAGVTARIRLPPQSQVKAAAGSTRREGAGMPD